MRLICLLSISLVGGCNATSQGTPCEQSKCANGDHLSCEAGAVRIITCDTACDAELGCVTCVPGDAYCDGDKSMVCAADGTGYQATHCDAVMDVSCGDSGLCEGECSPQFLGEKSYIGCEYFPTITPNRVDYKFLPAVVLANASTDVARVQIDGGMLSTPIVLEIAPGGSEVQELPWDPQLRGCGEFCNPIDPSSVAVSGGAYHIRSNRPITAYQFSPLNHTDGDDHSYSNDASVLLPSNTWGTNYTIAGWGHWYSNPGAIVITAKENDTKITLDASAAVDQSVDVNAITLQSGDVVVVKSYENTNSERDGADLTGSSVSSNKPIQVISAHSCTQIPTDTAACDHLEETMLPNQALGKKYVVTYPTIDPLQGDRDRLVRIVAVEDNTEITSVPAGVVNATLANAGDFIELATSKDVELNTTKKVVVAQYMKGIGHEQTEFGDPAMTVAVPVVQYRNAYRFLAPDNYDVSYVNIVARLGTSVTLDGMPVTDFIPIVGSEWGSKHVELQSTAGGHHQIDGTDDFGISVYGYARRTSYWYPGGLNVVSID